MDHPSANWGIVIQCLQTPLDVILFSKFLKNAFQILDNAKSELHNEKEVEFHMCKDVEAGVPKLIYEQVTLPDIYFRNPTFVEDM